MFFLRIEDIKVDIYIGIYMYTGFILKRGHIKNGFSGLRILRYIHIYAYICIQESY